MAYTSVFSQRVVQFALVSYTVLTLVILLIVAQPVVPRFAEQPITAANGGQVEVLAVIRVPPPNVGPGMRFEADGSILLRVRRYADYRPFLWNLSTGRASFETTGWLPDQTSLVYSPDRLRWTMRNGNLLYVWPTGGTAPMATVEATDDRITSVAFNTDSTVVAFGNGADVWLWAVEQREVLRVLQGHRAPVYSVLFDRSGTLLASVSQDGEVQLWGIP